MLAARRDASRSERDRQTVGLRRVVVARGARVEYLTCYHRGGPDADPAPLFERARCGRLDALTVTSSEGVTHLLALPGWAVLADVPLFVPHPRIADVAQRGGFRAVIPTGPGDAGLLDGLCAFAEAAARYGYAMPVFTDVPIASDFVPPANSYSVSSQQYYGGTTASVSKTLQQGSFTALLNDGITDPLLAQEGHELWFKFFQDRARSAYEICQGKLGINRTFSVAGRPQAACVIAASSVGSRVA